MKKWTEQIDKNTQNFLEYFGELNDEKMNWKPNANTWSIAQNIDHLIIINSSYFPIIDSIRNGTFRPPSLSKIGFVVAFFEKMIFKTVQPDRKRKMKTFPIWEPTKSKIPEGILDRFNIHQSELKFMIDNSAEFVDRGVVISSPANKNVVYKLGKAFEIIIAHEQRHFEQAKEMLALLKDQFIDNAA